MVLSSSVDMLPSLKSSFSSSGPLSGLRTALARNWLPLCLVATFCVVFMTGSNLGGGGRVSVGGGLGAFRADLASARRRMEVEDIEEAEESEEGEREREGGGETNDLVE